MIRRFFLCLFFIGFSAISLSAKDDKFFNNTTSLEKNKSVQISPQEKLGIKIESIRLTAYGKLVDLRFRVLDESKASVLFNPKLKPYITDSKSGNKFYVPNTPKVGSLRSYGTPVKNRVYFMLFGNTGELKKGSIVNIVIGDVTIEKLVIE